MKISKQLTILCLLVTVVVLSVVSCAKEEVILKDFTLEELKEFDGVDGHLAYVAYKGKVYDVTGLDLWPEGNHYDLHQAGFDLTEFLEDAPHDEGIIFDTATLVGNLIE